MASASSTARVGGSPSSRRSIRTRRKASISPTSRSSAAAAKLINTYLALYRATGDALDLAKARTLGDALVSVQDDDGRVPTHWNVSKFGDRDYDWVNCMLAGADALGNLAAIPQD